MPDTPNLKDLETTANSLFRSLDSALRTISAAEPTTGTAPSPYQPQQYKSQNASEQAVHPSDPPTDQIEGIVAQLELCAGDCERDLHDRLKGLKRYHYRAVTLERNAAAEALQGESGFQNDIARCRSLIKAITQEIEKARKVVAGALSGRTTGRTGAASVIFAPTKSPGPTRTYHSTPSLLDETLYLLGSYAYGKPAPPPTAPTPYLRRLSKERDLSLADKALMGGGVRESCFPEEYSPVPSIAKPYPQKGNGYLPPVSGPYSPPDTNDPTQKANYEQQRGRLYY